MHHLLVVEPHRYSAIVLRRLLEHLGYEPIVVASREDALVALRGDTFDAMLVEADQLSSELRALSPARIVATTSKLRSLVEPITSVLDIDRVLVKPIRIADLTQALERPDQPTAASTCARRSPGFSSATSGA